MARFSWKCIVTMLFGSLVACGVASAQVPPPPPAAAPCTLWHFLGIPQTYHHVHDNCINKFGFMPCLESKPALKKIGDPANLQSPNPAIAAAAKIKAEEDLAPQKIKAIRYLAKIGCGCYNKDKAVTKALVAAMEDCTEDVRLAAVNAIINGAESDYCVNCGSKSCCSPEVTEMLVKIAYERDDQGCPIEPSERVREAAIRAIRACCPGGYPMTERIENMEMPERPENPERPEVPGTEPTPATPPGVLPPNPVPPAANPPASVLPSGPGAAAQKHGQGGVAQKDGFIWLDDKAQKKIVARQVSAGSSVIGYDKDGQPLVSSRRKHLASAIPLEDAQTSTETAVALERLPSVADQDPTATRRIPATSARLASARLPSPGHAVRGQIETVDARQGLITLQVHDNDSYQVGEQVSVFHDYLTGRAKVADLVIIQSAPGKAVARAAGVSKLSRVGRGDDVLVIR